NGTRPPSQPARMLPPTLSAHRSRPSEDHAPAFGSLLPELVHRRVGLWAAIRRDRQFLAFVRGPRASEPVLALQRRSVAVDPLLDCASSDLGRWISLLDPALATAP